MQISSTWRLVGSAWCAVTLAAVALPLSGQTPTSGCAYIDQNRPASGAGGALSGTLRITMMRPRMAVTGAPFSADRVMEFVQVGAGGTPVTQSRPLDRIYRDSAGRVRQERALGPPGLDDPPMLVEIVDPVADCGYSLDVQHKVAHRFSYGARPVSPAPPQPGAAGGGCGPATSQAALPPAATATEITHEDLGMRMIEGVMARGSRTVQTWPPGSRGDNRLLVSMGENWYSDEIRETILTRTVNPRGGESTMRATNIDRTEPPAELFTPPPDYTVVDETGPFEIQWTATPKITPARRRGWRSLTACRSVLRSLCATSRGGRYRAKRRAGRQRYIRRHPLRGCCSGSIRRRGR